MEDFATAIAVGDGDLDTGHNNSSTDGSSIRQASQSWLRDSNPIHSTDMKMEEELSFLRQEVKSKAETIKRLQVSLYDQQVRSNATIISLRTQLRKKDRTCKQVAAERDQQMTSLLSRLLFLEGQLRKEQQEIEAVLQEKDDVIRRQRSAIEDLASKNTKYLTALKEAHGYSGGNGINPQYASTVVESEKGGTGLSVLGSPQVVLRNKDKSKVRFSSVKDKLRRHKSSLELYHPDSLETLSEVTMRYGSQENLSSTNNSGGVGMSSDELKKTRLQERKEKSRSMIDYPQNRLNDLPEVSSEAERGRAESPVSSFSFLQESRLQQEQKQHYPTYPEHYSYPNSQHPMLQPPQGPHSPLSSHNINGGSHDVFFSGKQKYGELSKSTSMPQSLSTVTEMDSSAKERPLSLSGIEHMTSTDKVSLSPSPTSHVPPGGSESNPFKSFKNVFKRRNSKQRSKQRPASTSQVGSQEYHQELKEHFKKYDLP